MNESHNDPHAPGTNAAAEAAEAAERAEAARAEQAAEARLVPEAIQAADTDHRAALVEDGISARARGVDWVRPSDLLARGSGHAARAAIDFHAHLAEQARTGLRAGASRLGERARRLPPVTAFGRGQAGWSGAESDEAGMI